MAAFEGTCTFDFGAVPGSNITTAVVADTNVTTASRIEFFLMGNDSTADHVDYTHSVLPMLGGWSATPIAIVNATNFTARAASQITLTGTIKTRYVIST